MKKDLCSITISQNLKELGFKVLTHYYYSNECKKLRHDEIVNTIKNWNNHFYGQLLNLTSVPTVDQAIDWIREKYDVIVFNHVAPYVDPRDKKNRIAYIYNVKYCNRKSGWNGRVHISYGKCASYNIYAAKRMAIMEAIRWIKKNRICSKKTKK